MLDWREKLRDFLISGGTDGRLQSEILVYLANVAVTDEVVTHLEAWRVEGKVDRYTIPSKGRPSTKWRATTRLLTELPSEIELTDEEIDGELAEMMTAPKPKAPEARSKTKSTAPKKPSKPTKRNIRARP